MWGGRWSTGIAAWSTPRTAGAGAYGIGLSAGFVPWGRLGGEASFRGQANGLWLWQNDVGQMIVDQVLNRRRAQSLRSHAHRS